MKGFVRLSRFTPGLANAEDVCLQQGDVVQYQCAEGLVSATVQHSDLRQHENGHYGYECRFHDTGQLGFACELRIVNWTGKS